MRWSAVAGLIAVTSLPEGQRAAGQVAGCQCFTTVCRGWFAWSWLCLCASEVGARLGAQSLVCCKGPVDCRSPNMPALEAEMPAS